MKNTIPYLIVKQLILISLIFITATTTGQITTNTYDFQSLAANVVINGQDNWQYMGNMNNSSNIVGSAGCAIPSGAAPANVANTVNSGLYTGGIALRNPGTTGGTHGFTSRKNNAGWNYSIPVSSDYMIFEFDYDNGNWWGEIINLGYDKNADGNFSSSCSAPDFNELGIGLSLSVGNLILYKADGTTISTTRVGSGWTKYRITIDLRANGGQGAGYVSYRVLGTSSAWQQVNALQNINMNINPLSVNQNNLQNLNGIIVQQEAGGVGIVDNISITTYKNNILLPITICSGSALNLSSISIPNTNVYNWLTPQGTTFTTSVPSLTINNTPITQNGIFTVSSAESSLLTWTVPVIVNISPTITSINTLTICSGSNPNIIFTSNVNSTYTWFAINNMNISGESIITETTSILNNTLTSNLSITETVIYSVTPTLGNCVGTTQQITVTINPTLTPAVSLIASNTTLCAGTSVSFTAASTNGGTTPIYQWQVNGINTGSNSNIFPPTILNNNDVVTVLLNSNAKCVTPTSVTSISITVSVTPKPIADFVYSPNQLTEQNPNVNFQNTSVNSTNWNWNFGTNTDTSILQNPNYTYPGAGVYLVTLQVYNGICSSITTKTIVIDATTAYYIPNIFTPNEDSINDNFSIVGHNISTKNYRMSIFNCWGELIFKTSSITSFWDGKTLEGDDVPQGVYIYTIEFELTKPLKKIKEIGFVTVSR